MTHLVVSEQQLDELHALVHEWDEASSTDEAAVWAVKAIAVMRSLADRRAELPDAHCTPTAVQFVIRDAEGKVLMESRPEYGSGVDPFWMFPGGKIDNPSETPEHAVHREVLEETGCKAVSVEQLGQPLLSTETGYLVQPYLVQVDGCQPPPQSLDDNHAPLSWQDPSDVAAWERRSSRTEIAFRVLALLERRVRVEGIV